MSSSQRANAYTKEIRTEIARRFFAFSDKALTPDDHEIEVFHEQVGNDIPVLIITKKQPKVNDLARQYCPADS